ncbi:MAG: DEAD/DEAH box helicase family protein, partial [Chloroflexi bacterium]|nr:DEAD/DEAH box helicase family protein [Chloroflexota bacterium]
MGKKGIFKTDFGSEQPRLDPEALFRDLKERAPEIKHLWSHQADILREYYNQYANTKDIAIELPTGTGKTLVGLLIAEFRRRTFNERVAYLCPTKQLAKQVTTQAIQYGIKGFTFVGKQRDYDASEFSEYQAGQAIAITNYSSVFNTRPRIHDAHTLILDDAHASENYLTSMWSVEISRLESNTLYDAILDLYKPALSEAFVASLSKDSPDHYHNVDVVPGQSFRSSVQTLRDILDSQLDEDDSAWYAWHTIKQHLPACNMFIGGKSILLRPTIPPTLSHAPFCNANQRVYMSATLGAGGELERITGIKHIERIPMPSGWDKRGSGRRLFLLPQVVLDEDHAQAILIDATKQMARSLVLVPSQTEARVLRDILRDSDVTVIGAGEIEDSIDVFGKSTGISLILSRYDGLDLPDDTCRLLVFGGLPAGINLQERFYLARLAASSMLRDRILTRFTQGVGRCTRSDNDYAVVILYGKALVDFILKVENRRILHPELQAEIEFGIENSKDKNPKEFAELWKVFLQRDEAWTEAEKAITGLREAKIHHSDPTVDRLRLVVADEVEYQYALWRGDYDLALE